MLFDFVIDVVLFVFVVGIKVFMSVGLEMMYLIMEKVISIGSFVKELL